MAKTYKVEIAFSGGFVFWIDTDEKGDRPKKAESVEVLVVPVEHCGDEVPAHKPYVLWRAKDYVQILKGIPLDSAPDAHQHICADLPTANDSVPEIGIEPSGEYGKAETELTWAPTYMGARPRYPVKVKQDRFLDWIPNLRDAGLESVVEAKAAAKILLPAGKLRCSAVTRGYRDSDGKWMPTLWKYVGQPDGTGKALAHQVVLRMKGLEEELTITGLGDPYEDLELHPGPGGTLRLAFTNLPEKYDGSGAMHFELYEAIGTGTLTDLEEDDVYLTPDSTCPPTWYKK